MVVSTAIYLFNLFCFAKCLFFGLISRTFCVLMKLSYASLDSIGEIVFAR